MKGVFINSKNLQEKIPSVVKEFEGKDGVGLLQMKS